MIRRTLMMCASFLGRASLLAGQTMARSADGFLGALILNRLTLHIDYRDNLMKFDDEPGR